MVAGTGMFVSIHKYINIREERGREERGGKHNRGKRGREGKIFMPFSKSFRNFGKSFFRYICLSLSDIACFSLPHSLTRLSLLQHGLAAPGL